MWVTEATGLDLPRRTHHQTCALTTERVCRVPEIYDVISGAPSCDPSAGRSLQRVSMSTTLIRPHRTPLATTQPYSQHV